MTQNVWLTDSLTELQMAVNTCVAFATKNLGGKCCQQHHHRTGIGIRAPAGERLDKEHGLTYYLFHHYLEKNFTVTVLHWSDQLKLPASEKESMNIVFQ